MITTSLAVGDVGYTQIQQGHHECIKMSTSHVNSLIIAGYPQEDTTLIKQAGVRITNANLCGGD